MRALTDQATRDLIAEKGKRSAGCDASEESLFATYERLLSRESRDPMADVTSSELDSARQLIAIRGEEETYESICAAIDFLYPNLRGQA